MKKVYYMIVSIVLGISCSNVLQAVQFDSEISLIRDKVKSRMIYSWKDDSPVPIEDLRYVTLSHYTFSGEIEKGEIIVHNSIAQDIVDIFKTLFENKFPITCMKLVDEYEGDDNTSIDANNCYAHCTRKVAREERWSNHAFGLAIDINPQINPFVKGDYICPKEGSSYLTNRSKDIPGMITKDSLIYNLFIERGFEWGGECFKAYEDLHHFQKVIPGLNKTQN